MKSERLTGAMTDPCPICTLRPCQGVTVAEPEEPTDKPVLAICIACGLVQKVQGGMRVPLTDADDWMFYQPELVKAIMAQSMMRAKNPLRGQEMIREQHGQFQQGYRDYGSGA